MIGATKISMQKRNKMLVDLCRWNHKLEATEEMTRSDASTEDKNKGTMLSRRRFLKTAGAMVAGLAVGTAGQSPVYSLLPSRVIGANDRIGLGFIGCGLQGMLSLRAAKEAAGRTKAVPVAVCDVFDKRREEARLCAQVPESKSFTDYQTLLECKDVDAVFISTPEHWHAQIAIDAMGSGLHCYIEKPLTRSLEEAMKLYDTAKQTGRVVQVGSQLCSNPKWSKAYELVKSKKIGDVVWSQTSYCRNSREGEWNCLIDSDANESTINWNQWLGNCPKIPFNADRFFRWRKYSDYSAGIISDLFPHRILPLMKVLGGEFPKKVSCIGTRLIHTDREVPDTQHVMIEFPSGHTMIVAGSTANEQGLPDIIHGHKATIYIEENKIELKPERPYAGDIEELSIDLSGYKEGLEEHQKDFYECIRTGKTPNCDIDLGVKAQVIISLAEISCKDGKMISFDSEKRQIIK
jgi:predicted dehydrogenase